MNILVAEDNTVLAKNIVKCLDRSGYKAIAVSTVSAAQKILADTPVSALCLDLQLADGNGLSVIENREGFLPADLPVVVMTGSGTTEFVRRAKACRVKAFLAKPFPLNVLKDIISDAIGQPSDKSHARQGNCGQQYVGVPHNSLAQQEAQYDGRRSSNDA